MEGICTPKTFPPYYAIAKKLYQEIGVRDLTVVFTDWEEDWWPWGCVQNSSDSNGNYIYPFEYAPVSVESILTVGKEGVPVFVLANDNPLLK